jgi:hypothetical protein
MYELFLTSALQFQKKKIYKIKKIGVSSYSMPVLLKLFWVAGR